MPNYEDNHRLGSKPFDLLIIDDHPLYRKGLKALFQTKNYIKRVLEASGGHPGIKQFKRYKPPVVLLDISMDDMNGLTCLKALLRTRFKMSVITLFRYDETLHAQSNIRYAV